MPNILKALAGEIISVSSLKKKNQVEDIPTTPGEEKRIHTNSQHKPAVSAGLESPLDP